MPPIHSQLTVLDGDTPLSIEFRIWRDASTGKGLAALDPKDNASRTFLASSRGAVQAILGAKYQCGQLVCYEGQDNGSYTPQKEHYGLLHGASVPFGELARIGESIEAQGWENAQKLDSHRLPPHTPHGQGPSFD